MAWYRVYKTYRGGKSPVDYFDTPKYCRKQEVKEYAESWAENSSGGHNYGWTVYWIKVKRPPKKWLKKKIKRIESLVVYYNKEIKKLQEIYKK